MVKSRLNEEIEYIEERKISNDDVNYEASLYEATLDEVKIKIAIGQANHKYNDKGVVFYPIYLINKIIVRIGLYEVTDLDAAENVGENGEPNINLLGEPLLYKFVNKYFINKYVVINEPDAEEPDAEEPYAEEPDAEEPDAEEPDAEEPDYNNEEDKIAGTILGHALGDALGAPAIFYPHSHYTGKLETPFVIDNTDGENKTSSVGQVTDNSEMATVLLETIIDGYTTNKAIINYMTWAINDPKPAFIKERSEKLFVATKPKIKSYTKRSEKNKEDSESNDALMRAYAMAFFQNDETIIKDVYITNPSTISYEAVFLYIEAIKMALKGQSKNEIKETIKNIIKNKILAEVYSDACNNKFRDVTHNKSHLTHGFYCAFWGLFNYNDYKTAIDAIICLSPSENTAAEICKPGKKLNKNKVEIGDINTNAAIAGGLLGAFYGLKKLQHDPTTKKNLQILLNSDPNSRDFPRSKNLILNEEKVNLLVSGITGLNNSTIYIREAVPPDGWCSMHAVDQLLKHVGVFDEIPGYNEVPITLYDLAVPGNKYITTEVIQTWLSKFVNNQKLWNEDFGRGNHSTPDTACLYISDMTKGIFECLKNVFTMGLETLPKELKSKLKFTEDDIKRIINENETMIAIREDPNAVTKEQTDNFVEQNKVVIFVNTGNHWEIIYSPSIPKV